MFKLAASLVFSAVVLAPAVALAEEPAPRAEPTPMSLAPAPRPDLLRVEYPDDPPMTTERRVGVGLVAPSALLFVPAGIGTFVGFAWPMGCSDGCPRPLSAGAKVAIVAGDAVVVGALVTGIVLIVEGRRPDNDDKRASRRIRPTADGVAFTF